MDSKSIVISVGSQDFNFNVEMQDYNDFVNAMAAGGDKFAPAHNLCVNSVSAEDEPKLKELLQNDWGSLSFQIAGEIVEQVTPKVEVTVKKQKTGQKPSKTTG